MIYLGFDVTVIFVDAFAASAASYTTVPPSALKKPPGIPLTNMIFPLSYASIVDMIHVIYPLPTSASVLYEYLSFDPPAAVVTEVNL